LNAKSPLPQRPAKATIADVAAAAGVSKATVSRFLNHRERLLSPDIATRVETAIAALGYSPSPMAQALSRGRSRLIGLIVADISNPYSVAVLRGAEKACQDAGYLVMLFNLGNDFEREREAIDALAGYQVDGFILNTSGRGAGLVDADALHGKPAVLVDRRHAGMHTDFVALDNRAAMRTACQHLVDGGYRELLYITESLKGVSSRRERAAAFGACMSTHQPRVAGDIFESLGEEGAGAALDDALRGVRKRAARGQKTATGNGAAVIAGNAVVTLRVAQAMARLDLKFGRDIGFIGFDDPDWASLIGPGLSTISQPTDEIGRTAANCLIERLKGLAVPPRQVLLPGALMVRGSSVRTDG
jgi:LacI family kdg operon repressor